MLSILYLILLLSPVVPFVHVRKMFVISAFTAVRLAPTRFYFCAQVVYAIISYNYRFASCAHPLSAYALLAYSHFVIIIFASFYCYVFCHSLPYANNIRTHFYMAMVFMGHCSFHWMLATNNNACLGIIVFILKLCVGTKYG